MHHSIFFLNSVLFSHLKFNSKSLMPAGVFLKQFSSKEVKAVIMENNIRVAESPS